MSNDWRTLIDRRARDIQLDPHHPAVVVRLDNNRSHKVRVGSAEDGYVLEAVIAGPAHTARLDDPVAVARERNRNSRMVGYRVDARGRLVAHAWTPREGLSREMLLLLVRRVASEADRHELLLTGLDRR